MQDQTPAIVPLPKDVWAQVFKYLLSDKRSQNASVLSLVCRDFSAMLKQRPDLEPYKTLKSRWLTIVKAELSLQPQDQRSYFAECAVGLQISVSGPVGLQQKLNNFNYLECQYLRLVALAMEGFQPWHGVLLLKAKAMLVENPTDTLAKLALLVIETKNPKLRRADEQSSEYLLYLKAKVVLGVLINQPLESIFSSQPPQQRTSNCSIL